MKNKLSTKSILIIVSVSIVVIIAIVLIIRIIEKGNPPIITTNEQIQQEHGIPVEVEKVAKRSLIVKETFTGTVEGINETMIYPKVSSQINQIRVKIGERVSVNDTIAVFDTKSIGGMNLKYDQTRSAYLDAEKDFERMKNLYEVGAISEQVYDKARLKLEINKSNWDAIVSAIFVTTPIDGVVTELFYDEGDLPQKNSAIAKVVNYRKVKIKIQVNEADISKLKVGQTAQIKSTSYSKLFNGKISEISLSANPATRNFEVTVIVPNKELLLRSGMFAEVTLFLTEIDDVISVSKDALVISGNESVVFLVDEDNLIHSRKIVTGQDDGVFVSIRSGLNVGETVIIEGQNRIKSENQKAIVKNPDSN